MSASKAANKEVELEKARREKERREFKEAQELESLRRAFRRINKSGSGKACKTHLYCPESRTKRHSRASWEAGGVT